MLIDPVAHHRETQILVPFPIQPIRPQAAHALDQAILATLESASEPIGVWQILNSLARSTRPATRVEGRLVKQMALSRINPLLKSGMIKRIGRTALALP